MKYSLSLDKLHSLKEALSSISYSVISDVLLRGSTFVLAIILANKLSNEDYGVFIYGSSLLMYFLAVSNFGLESYGIINANKNDEFLKKIVAGKVFASVFSFLLLLGFVFLTVSGDLHIKLAISFIGLRVLFNSLGVDWLFQVEGKFKNILVSNLIYSSVLLLFSFFFVKDLYVACLIFSGAFLVKLIYLNIDLKWTYYSFLTKKELFSLLMKGFPFFLVVISQQFSTSISKILIPYFSSFVALGSFDVSFRFFLLFDMFLVGAMKFLVPLAAKKGSSIDLWRFLIIIGFGLSVSFLFNLHRVFTELFFNQEINDNYPNYFYLFAAFSSLAYVAYHTLCLKKMIKKVARINIILMVLGVALNVWLISIYGLLGAAIAMVLVKATECILYLLILKRV